MNNPYNNIRISKRNNYMSRKQYVSSSAKSDYGPNPFVIDIEKATEHNDAFRTVLWTSEHLQLTLMSIPVGGDIGLEVHTHLDQFLRIEDGDGLVQMGESKEHVSFRQPVYDGSAILVPAGTWHNVINTGSKPLKLYTLYSSPNHPAGAVHQTKEIAEAAEHN